jgi:pSer/pThr/pTyr-binding forkhead associated (FHA) protein
MRTAAGEERPFRLRNPRTIIGREVRCDIRSPLPKIAGRHCELTRENGRLILRDLGATAGGTIHNGRRVQEAVLEEADRITVGPVTFEVRFQTAERAAELDAGRPVVAERARSAAPMSTVTRAT